MRPPAPRPSHRDPMRVLAIDTSAAAASVAIYDAAERATLFAESREMAHGQAEALAPMVARALAELDGGVQTPGARKRMRRARIFTGIRIGLALARAICAWVGRAGDRRFDPHRVCDPSAPRAEARRHRLGDRRRARPDLPAAVRSFGPTDLCPAGGETARSGALDRPRAGVPRRQRGARSSPKRRFAPASTSTPRRRPTIPTSSRSRSSARSSIPRRRRRDRYTSSRLTRSPTEGYAVARVEG